MKNHRPIGALILVVISVFLVYNFKLRSELSPSLIDPKQVIANAALETFSEGLRPHALQNLSAEVEVSTLFLYAISRDFEPDLTQELDVDLPDFIAWNEHENGTQYNLSFGSTVVDVKQRKLKPDSPCVIFGVATTLERLDDSLEAFAHWASNNNTIIVAIVPLVEEDSEESSEIPLTHSHMRFHQRPKPLSVSSVIEKAQFLSINLIVQQSSLNFTSRVVSLLRVLYDEVQWMSTFSNTSVEWVSIIDDDTFFPSIARLHQALSSYNTSLPHYVGAFTEDLDQLNIWGYFAYGGAGIFLSMPLLHELEPYFETCLAPLDFPSGDGRISECIYKYTTTKLSIQRGLNQVDLRGDQTGFYEAVRPLPISVHHWKSWGEVDMVTVSAIADITGEDSVLQKYHLSNGWWMTHGFSIVKYSDEDDDNESSKSSNSGGEITSNGETVWIQPPTRLSHRNGAMEATFATPETDDPRFWHSVAPLRPEDPDKQQYLLEKAVRENDRTMTLYYVRREDWVGQGVIRVVWTERRQ